MYLLWTYPEEIRQPIEDMKKDIQIYPHNQLAYEKVCAAFEVSSRTCVIHPTGTGKMYISMLLIDDNADKNILYLTSYSPILSALETEMAKCEVSAENLTVALYAGLDEVTCAQEYDYIIMDEFHRAGAEVWGSWISKLLSNNPQAKILGLSATPIRYLDNNRDMSDELFDGNVASHMTLAEAVGTDILKMPKYVCALYSISEEFARYADRVNKMKPSKSKTEAMALLEKARRSLEQADGLSKIFADHMTVKDGRYIVFCRNYEHMESMQIECKEWLEKVNPNIQTYELRAAFSQTVNQQTIASFNADNSSKLKLLFTVDMLNEGVHASEIDGCIMLRPTESMNIYLQQLGRAISVSNRTQTVVFDIVNNSLQLNAMRSFKEEVEQIASVSGSGIDLEDFEIHENLRDFFDIISNIDYHLMQRRWTDWFADAKVYFANHGHLLVPDSHLTDEGYRLGIWIANQRSKYASGNLSTDRINLLNSIGMVWSISEMREDEWQKMYSYAKEFFAKNGNLRVKQGYKTSDGTDLGKWISHQRTAYSKGRLSVDHIAQLNAIEMMWNTHDTIWDKMFILAKSYYDTHGHLRVKQRSETDERYKGLGVWISAQRRLYILGELTQERKEHLESIGMVWNDFTSRWDEMYAYAKAYFQKNGNLNIERKYVTKDGTKLGVWIVAQRKRQKNGRMKKEQEDNLNAIGMIWDTIDYTWDQMYSYAKSFYEANSNLYVGVHYMTPNNRNLALWLARQRKAYITGTLPKDKQQRLEAIGMVWTTDEKNTIEWETMFNLAQAHYQEHGNLNIPYSFDETKSSKTTLGNWIRQQRKKYREGKLSAEQISRLNSIGMSWHKFAERWDEIYASAQAYYEANGNLTIPYNIRVSGISLSGWVLEQRTNYKEGTLSKDRIAKLEAIGIDWFARDAYWEKRYAAAKQFYDKNGHLLVSSSYVTADGINLGSWVHNLRAKHKKGRLSEERQHQLEEIGMIWGNVRELAWEEMYRVAQVYYNTHGHLSVSDTFKAPNGKSLNQWLDFQRSLYKSGTLSEDRIARLEAIGIAWSRKSG